MRSWGIEDMEGVKDYPQLAKLADAVRNRPT